MAKKRKGKKAAKKKKKRRAAKKKAKRKSSKKPAKKAAKRKAAKKKGEAKKKRARKTGNKTGRTAGGIDGKRAFHGADAGGGETRPEPRSPLALSDGLKALSGLGVNCGQSGGCCAPGWAAGIRLQKRGGDLGVLITP